MWIFTKHPRCGRHCEMISSDAELSLSTQATDPLLKLQTLCSISSFCSQSAHVTESSGNKNSQGSREDGPAALLGRLPPAGTTSVKPGLLSPNFTFPVLVSRFQNLYYQGLRTPTLPLLVSPSGSLISSHKSSPTRSDSTFLTWKEYWPGPDRPTGHLQTPGNASCPAFKRKGVSFMSQLYLSLIKKKLMTFTPWSFAKL